MPGFKPTRGTLGLAKEPIDLASLKQIPAAGGRAELRGLRHSAKWHGHNQAHEGKGSPNPHGAPGSISDSVLNPFL
jgi:hypothetical protein